MKFNQELYQLNAPDNKARLAKAALVIRTSDSKIPKRFMEHKLEGK